MEEKKTNPYNKNNKLITLNPPAYKQRRSARDEGQRRRLLRIEKERERERMLCTNNIISIPKLHTHTIRHCISKKIEIDIYPNTF